MTVTRRLVSRILSKPDLTFSPLFFLLDLFLTFLKVLVFFMPRSHVFLETPPSQHVDVDLGSFLRPFLDLTS